jgi:hypothetical protein
LVTCLLILRTDAALVNSMHVKTASRFAPPIRIALLENFAGPLMKTTAVASPRELTQILLSQTSSAIAVQVN